MVNAITPGRERPRCMPFTSGLGGEVFADSADGVALALVQGQEFEAVAKSLAIADNGANLDGIRSERQGDVESDDLTWFEAAGESGSDSVLANFGGTSPAGTEFPRLKHFDLQADIDRETGEAPGEIGFSARPMAGGSAGSCSCSSGSGPGFILSAHANSAARFGPSVPF